jgi:hypothetical protein
VLSSFERAGKEEEEEEEEEEIDSTGGRRKLLAYRLPAGKYKPLQPKCAASERVKKNIRPGEDAIVGCLKTNRCSHAVEDVFTAIQNLDGIKSLKNYVSCITVNGQTKGCGSITGNPETFPYIGTKPPPKAKKETTRTYKTCALVGNGPGLQREGMGEIIDKHDAVIRFNTFVSSGVWQNYTGVKSTLRVFNKKRLHLLDENERQKRRRKRVVDLLELHVLSVPPSGFTSEQKHRHHGARRHQIHGQRLLQISIGFTPFRI